MNRPFGALLAVAAVLCACSPKGTANQNAGTAAGSVSQASFDPATRIATIHAKDFAFDAPDSISAGWTTFHFVNDGPNLHHLQIVRLGSGKTVQDFEAALKNPGPPPAWAVFVGGPNAPNPGAESDAELKLTPGRYALICMVDFPAHVPHFAKGMVRPFTVTAAPNAVAALPALPKADVRVSLVDYNFDLKGALTRGKHTIEVTNKGPQMHEMEIIRFAPGKTVKDLEAWYDKMNGPPPGDAIGGITAVEPGMAPEFTTVDLTAGHYAFVCFVPDSKDGKPHLMHGMVKEFTIS